MDDVVISSGIAALAAIVTAILGTWSRISLSKIKEQVSNSHQTNLRDEVTELLLRSKSLGREIGAQRAEIAAMHTAVSKNTVALGMAVQRLDRVETAVGRTP